MTEEHRWIRSPRKFLGARLSLDCDDDVCVVAVDCCMDRVCWCFVTSGLCAVGQDEVVIVLERLPDEERIPSDVFYHICNLYHEAAKGYIKSDFCVYIDFRYFGLYAKLLAVAIMAIGHNSLLNMI